ncbi:MAG: GerW family sporulation protein [Lachnospiraceae bacterium]
MADHQVNSIVDALMKGLDTALTTKSVVGEVTHIGETIIVPLMDVSFGVGAGASAKDAKNGGGGGMTGKITPSAVLVISNGTVRLVNVKTTDNVSRALDLIPEIIEKIKPTGRKEADAEAVKAAFEEL